MRRLTYVFKDKNNGQARPKSLPPLNIWDTTKELGPNMAERQELGQCGGRHLRIFTELYLQILLDCDIRMSVKDDCVLRVLRKYVPIHVRSEFGYSRQKACGSYSKILRAR